MGDFSRGVGEYYPISTSPPNRLEHRVNPIHLSLLQWKTMTAKMLESSPYPVEAVGRVGDLSHPYCNILIRSHVEKNDHDFFVNSGSIHPKSLFRRRAIPPISLYDYMDRICHYLPALEPVVLMTSLYYADLLERRCIEKSNFSEHRFILDSLSAHRFIIVSLCLASKASGDFYYANSFYAKVGGITTKELNSLELELARLLGWTFNCPIQETVSIWRKFERELDLQAS